MTVLLYTYFYNISFNVLRPTFFNIYNLPFLRSPNIGKIRVKVGPETNHFSYILSSSTNRIAVFINFFRWYVANQETNKAVPAIFFFSYRLLHGFVQQSVRNVQSLKLIL